MNFLPEGKLCSTGKMPTILNFMWEGNRKQMVLFTYPTIMNFTEKANHVSLKPNGYVEFLYMRQLKEASDLFFINTENFLMFINSKYN